MTLYIYKENSPLNTVFSGPFSYVIMRVDWSVPQYGINQLTEWETVKIVENWGSPGHRRDDLTTSFNLVFILLRIVSPLPPLRL